MEENSIKDKKRFVCANAFYEGREYYYCLKKIPSYNWTMLFLVSADHVATNTMDMVNSIIRTFALVAACAFTILCSGFFVWYRSRRTRAMYEFELRTNERLSEVNQELEKAKKAAEEAAAPTPATVAAAPVQEADNSELIAVIAAAIAASEGTSTDGFVVRSIRKINRKKR